MPAPNEFLRGFGIHRGMKIGPFTLTDIQIEHQEIRRYREYHYPISLTFTGPSQQSHQLLQTLNHKVMDSRIIYSSYGNPYECSFGQLTLQEVEPNYTIIETTGTAVRI